MQILLENETSEVSGGVLIGLTSLFIMGYTSGAFDVIGREIGNGLYDGVNG